MIARVGFGEAGEPAATRRSRSCRRRTITPPIDVPWPPRNLVVECTTMCAPHSSGRMRYGVGTVLSTISGMPSSWPTLDMPSMSSTSFFGLASVSPKNAWCSAGSPASTGRGRRDRRRS